MKGGRAQIERLAHTIGAARLITKAASGQLGGDRAEAVAAFLRAAQLLVSGTDVPVSKALYVLKVQTGTRLFTLWRREPRCMWCGRVTRIDDLLRQDGASLDHLHPKGERKGRALPLTVLACRRCNLNRGQPRPTRRASCPVLMIH